MLVAGGECIGADLVADGVLGVPFIAGAEADGTFNADGLSDSFIVVRVFGAECNVGTGAGGELNVGMGAEDGTCFGIEAGAGSSDVR